MYSHTKSEKFNSSRAIIVMDLQKEMIKTEGRKLLLDAFQLVGNS
jgi:hypothetical protein